MQFKTDRAIKSTVNNPLHLYNFITAVQIVQQSAKVFSIYYVLN